MFCTQQAQLFFRTCKHKGKKIYPHFVQFHRLLKIFKKVNIQQKDALGSYNVISHLFSSVRHQAHEKRKKLFQWIIVLTKIFSCLPILQLSKCACCLKMYLKQKKYFQHLFFCQNCLIHEICLEFLIFVKFISLSPQ